jgi:hypothetical protein
MGKGEVIELNKKSEVIKRINVGGNPFSVKVLSDGNWLVACGDAHKYVVVDPGKQTVIKTISANEIADAVLLFVAELHCYKNGNVLLANWNGHSKDKTQPKLMEINHKNKVVWKLAPNELITNISTVYSFSRKK